MQRCSWCNPNNPLYIEYHDNEWGKPVYDDKTLFEFLVLEPFQAGLSWETILNKREAFRSAFDDFDYKKISSYDSQKVEELMQNKGIVRNRRKILATINNAKIFMNIQSEKSSFSKYIWSFTDGKFVYENDKTKSILSDTISNDLKRRGMTFVGTTIIYSYLQAIGIINSHEDNCSLNKNHP